MQEKCFTQDIKRILKSKYESAMVEKDDYYCHPMVYAHSVSEYIQIIEAISPVAEKADYCDTILYRGMVDKKYNIMPGLARLKINEFTEEALINRFRSSRPADFAGLTAFDVLAKMQHYGLPTRLLDFTLNPLVALYFACESKKSLDGRVLCHSSFLTNDSDTIVKAISEAIVNRGLDENYTINEYICKNGLSPRQYMAATYLFPTTMVVRPKYWNQRITNQSGVFMLFYNHHYDKYRRVLALANKYNIDEALRLFDHRGFEKDEIERLMNIEPIWLYSDGYEEYVTDEIYKEMVGAYKETSVEKEFWNSMGERFYMSSQLKPVGKDKLKKQFFSIIIKKNDKKRIINSLSKIGISEDYIYPELENSAKEIKRQYERTKSLFL